MLSVYQGGTSSKIHVILHHVSVVDGASAVCLLYQKTRAWKLQREN